MTAMRFGAFPWSLNPTELRVEDGRRTQETVFPFPALQDTGRYCARSADAAFLPGRRLQSNSPGCVRFSPAAPRY